MMSKRVSAAALFGLCLISGSFETALAQNSTQASPPSSPKLSGSEGEGDTSGAVRALGSADDGDKQGKPIVTVPRLGGEGNDGVGGTPRGTTR